MPAISDTSIRRICHAAIVLAAIAVIGVGLVYSPDDTAWVAMMATIGGTIFGLFYHARTTS